MANTKQQFVQHTFCVAATLLLIVVASANQILAEQPSEMIALISVAQIAGDAPDKSNLGGMKRPESISDSVTDPSAVSDETFAANIFGGISAADWSGNGDEYWFLSDRGPLDGAVDWPCRLHKVRLEISGLDESRTGTESQTETKISAEIVETVFLEDAYGHRFTGLASAYTPSKEHPVRLDPEGLRVSPNGTFYISDEYGPRLMEFSRTGRFIRELEVPAHYQIACPGTTWRDEIPNNETGRQANRGMEGLAISEDGKRLFGIMQSPLLQDCQRPSKHEKVQGLNCRLPVFLASGKLEAEYIYQLDDARFKLNEILECGPQQLLTIERDGNPGVSANCKNLMLVSLKSATNISGRCDKGLAGAAMQDLQPVTKRVLLDLLDPKWNLAGEHMPEKIESLTFGPDLPDGRRLLIVVSDNDFEVEHPTCIYAFAIPRDILQRSPDSNQSKLSQVLHEK